jgi:hypothetical protein
MLFKYIYITMIQFVLPRGLHLVGRRIRERGSRDPKTRVGGIEYRVEALQERKAVDEVQTLARVAAQL